MNTISPIATEVQSLSRKDFIPPNDVRWCPGCGDYAILNAVQKVFPELGIPRENFVIVSGIGCSSRFPYYMNTYGFHSIHGRATTVATGVKVANPDLSVWVVTGDGDGLSIGGNHMIHILRRNVDVKILLFNNKIYGLTKGQYSPTSEIGKVTKSSPVGSPEQPIQPAAFALTCGATFVARTIDTNPSHMQAVFKAAAMHKGSAFVEIMQNCVIFNDDAWEAAAGRTVRDEKLLMLEEGKPLIFGKDRNKGIRLSGLTPEIVTIGENGITEADLLVHNSTQTGSLYTSILSMLDYPDFPVPMGVIRSIQLPSYTDTLAAQRKSAVQASGRGNLSSLLQGKEYWEVKGNETGKTQAIPVTKSLSQRGEDLIMAERSREESAMSNNPVLSILKQPLGMLLQKMDIKTKGVLSPKDSVHQGVDRLKELHAEGLLVLDGNQLVGVLTERNILLKVVLKSMDRDLTPVSTIMSPHTSCLKETDSIAMAINKLAALSFRHLPIQKADGSYVLVESKSLLSYVLGQNGAKA